MDLTDIIKESVDSATDLPDAEGEQVPEMGGGEEAPVEGQEPPPEETPVEGKGPTPEELAALDKELESYGLKAPKPGARDNRIPYSRVRKITENAIRKIRESSKKDIDTRENELKVARERLANVSRHDELVRTNPIQYLQLLSHIHPQYAKFLNGSGWTGTREESKAKEKAPDDDPMPQPSGKFPDGSTGYTMEDLQKLFDWRDRRVEEKITGKITKQYEPLKQSYEQAMEYEDRSRHVNAQIENSRKTWGAMFDEHQEEILKAMEGANKRIPFEHIVASVLVPKMEARAKSQADTARAKVLEELKARPAAAKSPSPKGAGGDESDKPLTTEDVIRAELAKFKR